MFLLMMLLTLKISKWYGTVRYGTVHKKYYEHMKILYHLLDYRDLPPKCEYIAKSKSKNVSILKGLTQSNKASV
jgi:hypothetical protein